MKSQYLVSKKISIPASTKLNIVFNTGDIARTNFVGSSVVAVSEDLEISFSEAPVYTGGVAETNLSSTTRDSAREPVTTVLTDTTISDEGQRIFIGPSLVSGNGDNNNPGFITDSSAISLKKQEAYAFMIENFAAADSDVYVNIIFEEVY